MTFARALLQRLDMTETLLCELLLAAFVTLLFAQILARQLFGYSIAWSEELSTSMFVWFAYLGAVVAARMSAHNRVSFHFRWLPRAVGKAMLALSDLLWVVFNLYFAWLAWDFIFNHMNRFWKSQTLGVPMKWLYLILPIAFVLMAVRVLVNLYLTAIEGRQLLDPETSELRALQPKAPAPQAPAAR